jgi:hypothetical protein
MELAIGRIEHGGEVILGRPGKAEVMVVVFKGDEGGGQLEGIGDEPLGGAAADICFRAAGFIGEVFESGKECLMFIRAEGV